jgi:arylsulfatase A-like enzyme
MGLMGRVAVGVVAAAAVVCAYRYGGGAEARPAPPAPTTTPPPPPTAVAQADVVVARLVDAIDGAHITMPNLARGTQDLAMHWRKMPLAFHDLSAEGRKLTTSIALRTSATVVQWSVPTGTGKMWTPDARVWNMDEGSFDEREAIFAPTPAAIAFRVSVPPAAKLVFSPGTADDNGDATVFSVSVTDARGHKTTPYEKRFLPEETAHWVDDQVVDLSAFAGQSIELDLETRADPRRPDEPAPTKHRVRRTNPDAGVWPVSQASGQTGLSLALWGNPEIRARQPAKVPYNVLFIVVDALRPDVIPSFHDDAEDAKKRAAALPPLDALLPKVPGLMPNLDAIAAHGVRFTHAYSAGSWTRPGTVAMLSGLRSTELGLDPMPWVLPRTAVSAYYRDDPPLLPLLLRHEGVATRAFVNNYFMIGYAAVGIDMGFERVDDHRYRTRDTAEITRAAVEWLKRNKDARFFAFCNYNSPHEPLEPPERFLDEVPDKEHGGPSELQVRKYMAEGAKDDEAIGVLLHELDVLGLRKKTLVVVTADHGETLSIEHDGISKLDHMPIRFHHAVTNYEETTKIPILMSLPGVLPENVAVKARVRNVDIAPTILELLGQEQPAKMHGQSLMPLVRGVKEPDERVVLSEGRGTRGLIAGRWRAIFREGPSQTRCYKSRPGADERCITVAEELFDLATDPGERHNVARLRPDVMAEMRARLSAAKKGFVVAGTAASLAGPKSVVPVPRARTATVAQPVDTGPPRLRLRFSGAGAAHRVSGRITFAPGTKLVWETAGVARQSVVQDGASLDLALTTSPDGPVGLDVTPTPPSASVHWDLYLDDRPWPAQAVFAGPYGLFDARVASGLENEEAREIAFAHALPTIDPSRDLGLFVVREQATAHEADVGAHENAGANAEMEQLLREWGYAHGPAKR